MRTTLCYGLMTLCLGSTVVYMARGNEPIIYAAKQDPERGLETRTPNAAAAAEGRRGFTPLARPEQLAPGATRAEVLEALGQPTSIDGDRWVYGSRQLLFKNDRLAGCVSAPLSPIGTAWQVESVPAKVGKSAASQAQKPAPRRVVAKAAVRANTSSYASRARPALSPFSDLGSSRQSVLRPFQNVIQPMFRYFYSDQPLARGKSPATRRVMTNQFGSTVVRRYSH